MQHELIDKKEAEKSGNLIHRIISALYRRFYTFLVLIRIDNYLKLRANSWRVGFAEENISLNLIKNGYYKKSAQLFNQKEVLLRAIITHALRNGIIDNTKNIIDVGCFIGDNALPWAKMITGTLYAVDPAQKNIDFVYQTANNNEIKNIKTFTYAVGDVEGFIYPAFDIDHTPFTEIPLNKKAKNRAVKVITFDGLFKNNIVQNIGLLHLDVEGMELKTLKGSIELISNERPVVLFEAHITIDDINAIFEFLKRLNYSIFMINESTIGGRPDCINFLAFPNESNVKNAVDILNNSKTISHFYKAAVGPHLIEVS
jgi:FkbM family methyltransferase